MSVPADRMRRRSSTVPTLEDLRVAQAAQPAQPRSFIRQSLDEVGQAGRDAIRDPLDALGRAAAPLPGAGGVAARAGSAIGSVSRARLALGAAGTAGATVPLAATMARDDALASAAAPASAYQTSPRTRRRSTSGITQAPPGTENTFTGADGQTQRVQGGAAAPEAPAERVAAYGGNDADRIQLRGTQGSIIRNPDAMPLIDQLAQLQHTFKGSPSLRRAAAEALIGREQTQEQNYQNTLARNDQADQAQSGMQAEARRSFADRRLRADVSNQEVSETRRTNNQDYELGRADRVLRGAEIMAQRQAAATKVAGTANARTDALVAAELERDPTLTREQAIVRASNLAALEGENTQGSATGRAGDALASGAIDSAINSRQPGWFGGRAADALGRGALNLFGSNLSSPSEVKGGEVTPDAYTGARDLNWRERLQATIAPGVSRSDVVLTDRNGRNVALPRNALGGLTPEEYNRRGLLRRSTVD